mmetsp:Transcript_7997/g.16509  ORF Transcript_7997/g.16509 Transcript_7997/m.16509 type:complete len:230 (+) Transcript_7997:95-784(+)
MQSTSTILKFFTFILFALVALAEGQDEKTVAMTAMDLNYRAIPFECDEELQRLGQENKYKKIIGSVYRICFEPNEIARTAGVGIEIVNLWKWESSYAGGMAVQNALIDGEGISGLSYAECRDGGTICFLDTVLTSNFYNNPGTVMGNGEVSFTVGTGTVPVGFSIFQVSFTLKFKEGIEEHFEKEKSETTNFTEGVNEIMIDAPREAEIDDATTSMEDLKSIDEVKSEL